VTPALVELDIAEQPAAIHRTLTGSAATLAAARSLLEGSSLVRFLGVGSSRHVAGYAGDAADAFAPWPAAVAPAPGAATPVLPWRDGEALVAFSQSGETPAVAEAVARAKAHRAAVVAVVNARDSTLGRLADVCVAVDAGTERVVAATKSVTAQLAVARSLCRPMDESELDQLVAAVAAATELDVARAEGTPPPAAVVAGGFAGAWLADEVALKFAEIAGRSVLSDSIVEYLHGPIAAATTLLALTPAGDPNADSLPAGTLRVGAGGSADVIAPDVGEPSLDVIPLLVVAQRLVVRWAVTSGADPDASRGLAKVTNTA